MNSNKIATTATLITETRSVVSDTARTTDADRLAAKCLMKHFEDFDQEGRTEIRKQVTFLVGYILPDEVLIIIKSYLLLDIYIYRHAKMFWTMNIPTYRMITIAENEGLITVLNNKYSVQHFIKLASEINLLVSNDMDNYTVTPTPELFKGAPKMIYDAISKLPYGEQMRVYKVFCAYTNQWRLTISQQRDRLKYAVPYPTYVKKTVKAEHTRWVKKYDTFPIQDKLDHPEWYPNPAVYTNEHRYADRVKTIIDRFPKCVSHANQIYRIHRHQEMLEAEAGDDDGDEFEKIHMEARVFRNVVRCFDGTLEYIDRVSVDFGLSNIFLKDLNDEIRLPKINDRIRIENLGPKSPR
jgi:hypothetical protein